MQLKVLKVDRFHLCEIEMLLTSAYYPLNGFMTRKDYVSVIESLHLDNGMFWPLPVTLSVTESFADSVTIHDEILVQDAEGDNVAIMTVYDIWRPNKIQEVISVYGTIDTKHPGVNRTLNQFGPIYIGGPIRQIKLPFASQFPQYSDTANHIRSILLDKSFDHIVAFQTRNPIHKAHFELTMQALQRLDALLLLQPTIGPTIKGDIDYETRIKCYEYVLKYYPKGRVLLNLLPLAMRMAGPKEALLHGVIRRNFGCTHMIIGRDHAGVGQRSAGELYHKPYEAQREFIHYEQELGIKLIKFSEMVYAKDIKQYISVDDVTANNVTEKISGTELRHRLKMGKDIPKWFSFPEVIEELQQAYAHKVKNNMDEKDVLVAEKSKQVYQETTARMEVARNKFGENAIDIILGCNDLLGLTEEEAELILDKMELVSYARGGMIVEQGKEHDLFCVILSGKATVQLHYDDKVMFLAILTIGHTIGHIETDLKSMKRKANATVIALEEMETLQISIGQLQEIATKLPNLANRLTQKFRIKSYMNQIKQHSAFSLLSTAFAKWFASQAKLINFAEQATVYSRRINVDKVFLILSGELSVETDIKSTQPSNRTIYKKGAIIFDKTLASYPQGMNPSIVSLTPVTALQMSSIVVKNAIALNIQKFMEISDKKMQAIRIPKKIKAVELSKIDLSETVKCYFLEQKERQILLPIDERELSILSYIDGKQSIRKIIEVYLANNDGCLESDVAIFINKLLETGFITYDEK